MARRLLVILFAALLPEAGCGSRTTLPSDEAPPSAERDGPGTPGVPDDSGTSPAPTCVVDGDCKAASCVAHRCIGGHCRFDLRHQLCEDGVFCNGSETCTLSGCVTAPRSCDDSVSCTHDTCDEATRSCRHAKDDGLCPLSHGCDPSLGCQARALAHDGSVLYEVLLPSAVVKPIGATGMTLFDIALHPNGTVYGLSSSGELALVDTNTGRAGATVATGFFGNALDASPDDRLYGAGGGSVYAIDLASGTTTVVASFPPGLVSSGDLAFLGGRLLATAKSSGPDTLVELDRQGGAPRIVGTIGFPCVYGLAAFGITLYGLTCEGKVLTIDASTGLGTLVAETTVGFYGATAR